MRAIIRAGFRIGVAREGLSFDPEPDPPFEALVAALEDAYNERFAAGQGLTEALDAAQNEHVGLYVKDATAEGALILRPSGAQGLLWPDIYIEPSSPTDADVRHP